MKKKKIFNMILAGCLSMALLLTGCGGAAPSEESTENPATEETTEETTESEATDTAEATGEVVVLNYPTFNVGMDLNAPVTERILERFREEFAGKIEVEIEELPSDVIYADKMKVLAAAGELPDVIDGKNGIRDLGIKNGQAVDLRPFLDANPHFRDVEIGAEALAANTEEDGAIYSIASSASVAGYYYNKEMFAEAGIEPAKTWDEFMDNCEKLLAAGHTPLALMTGENSWTTNLFLAAMVASEDVEFMTTKYPDTYQNVAMERALERMQICLQKYTTADALGALYANAANNFLQEQAAMVANGSWMIGDFSNLEKTSEGFVDKVGFAMYPGDGIMNAVAEGYAMCAPPERQEAAFELLMALNDTKKQADSLILTGDLPVSSEIEIDDELKKESPLLAGYADATLNAKYRFATFDVVAYPSVVDAFAKYYPELAAGSLDAKGMIERLDEAAANAE